MNPANVLIAAGACVFGALGAIHLLYTFRGTKLHPRDPDLRARMEQSELRITRQTSVWGAYLGFNGTHSLGMLSFAAIYTYLALWRPAVLADSSFLMALGLLVLMAYGLLASRYFFSVPFRGVVLAGGLYALGWVLG